MKDVFVDTSALVKRYYPERDSAVFERQIQRARIVYISVLSITEMASALMRKMRMKELAAADEVLIWNAFQDDLMSEQVVVTVPDRRHYERASDIIRRLGGTISLRTLDALQIAVALDAEVDLFLCADVAACRAAETLGLNITI